MKYFYFFSILFSLVTLIPLVKNDAWWIRVFEFPRAQILVLGSILLLYSIYVFDNENIVFVVTFIFLLAFFVYQVVKILPYTFLYPKQMQDYHPQDKNADHVKLMVANVLMSNKNVRGLVELIHTNNPDILLVVEVDSYWHEQLQNSLNLKHAIAKPLDNTYGMALYSNFELTNSSIEFLIEDDIPSIHTEITLPSERKVYLHCLHPKPPAPQESTDTTERDAELLVIGKQVEKRKGPTIVAGDLNDVAWSYTTRLFQKISGLLDPRIGRGMFNSFHASIPILRFPLDHTFASEHFDLIKIKRLPSFGSDHFPIYIELALDNRLSNQEDTPRADSEDEQRANEKIKDAVAS